MDQVENENHLKCDDYFCCQLDEICSHVGDESLSTLGSDHFDLFNCGWHHSLGLDPRLCKRRE